MALASPFPGVKPLETGQVSMENAPAVAVEGVSNPSPDSATAGNGTEGRGILLNLLRGGSG